MRKWITLLMTLLVGSTVSSANATTGQVNLEAGYRRDNISWRHRFPSDSPVFSSSTKFKDIDIFQLGLNGRMTVGCNFYVRGNAYWGWILDGNFKHDGTTYFNPFAYDTYAEGEDFNFAFNRDRHNVIDDKYVYGVSAAIGYPFYFCDCTTSLAPVIGYSIDEQNICIEDEGFRLSRFDEYSDTYYGRGGFLFPVSGEDCCCRKFLSKWYGPFVGLDFNFRPYSECWNVYAQVEYHWGNFKGRRHDTGFTFFDRRDHRSDDVHGWVFAFGANYDLCNCWTVGFSLKFQDWVAHRHHRHGDSGSYESFFFSGSDRRQKTTDKWNSYAINLTIGRDF